MRKRIIAVLIAMGLVMTTLTGCVKVVKIGEEGNLTGEVEFSASDNVGSFWETQALPELTGKAVDLGEFLKEANGDLGSLADKYGFSEEQSKAILDLKLQRLVNMEKIKIEKELEKLRVEAEGLDTLVNDEATFKAAFIAELDRINN